MDVLSHRSAPEDLLQQAVPAALDRARRRFDEQLRSDLPPVSALVRHVERYRGKMLRPTLAAVCGLAAAPGKELNDDHITVAAVCEMVHMATLVHDDVLDEADMRRRGPTMNRLRGNETAVILGDYLIASAYHLCSQLDSQATALLIGHVSMVLCSGELLQLHHREDWSLDEPTYFEIVRRKTASLVGAACRLGAACSGADESVCRRFERFGTDLGVAFQIQDDLLDLTGRTSVLGKSVGKDLEKGKLTLPVIHHLAAADPRMRGETLRLLERLSGSGSPAGETTEAGHLVGRLGETGSIAYARAAAGSLVERAKSELAALPSSAASSLLLSMADAVIKRES